MKRDRILITGHVGKIGKLVWEGLNDTYILHGYDRADNRRDNVLNAKRLARAMRDCKAVIHLAAISHPTRGDQKDIFQTNVTGTLNLFESAVQAGVERIILASSITYYGIFTKPEWKPSYLPIDESHPPTSVVPHIGIEQLDMYGQSKVMAEQIGAWYGSHNKVECIALRFANLGDEESLFHRHLRSAPHQTHFFKDTLWTHLDPELAVQAITNGLHHPEQVQFEALNVANKKISSAFSLTAIIEENFQEIPLSTELNHMPGLFSVAKAERMLAMGF